MAVNPNNRKTGDNDTLSDCVTTRPNLSYRNIWRATRLYGFQPASVAQSTLKFRSAEVGGPVWAGGVFLLSCSSGRDSAAAWGSQFARPLSTEGQLSIDYLALSPAITPRK